MTGLAVKLTLVPVQMVVAEATMDTAAGLLDVTETMVVAEAVHPAVVPVTV